MLSCRLNSENDSSKIQLPNEIFRLTFNFTVFIRDINNMTFKCYIFPSLVENATFSVDLQF